MCIHVHAVLSFTDASHYKDLVQLLCCHFFFYHIALCIFLMERHVTGRKAFLNIFGSQIIFESNSYLYALSEDAIVFKAKFQKGQRKVLIITPQKSWREKAEQRLSR